MTKKEYLKTLETVKPDRRLINKAQKVYGELPEEVQCILSFAKESVFFDDGWRMLSFEEVMDAQKDLHVDFTGNGIIPLADCGENDFIVYHIADGFWSKFNIEDLTVFKKKPRLGDLLR